MGSLRRRFGAEAEACILELELCWISHMHADHHLGLLHLLELRATLKPNRPPLVVVGPQALQRWLRTAAAALHTPLYFRFVHCGAAPHDGGVGMAMRRLGFDRIAVSPVAHSFDAWAIALQHREGWGIVYSGDTRPCEGVVRLGRSLRPKARILVHEATFDDTPGMRREAEQRKHSTVAEALEVANQMGAWRVLLTHFSNRYPRLADVRGGGAAATRAVPAFDLMEARAPG